MRRRITCNSSSSERSISKSRWHSAHGVIMRSLKNKPYTGKIRQYCTTNHTTHPAGHYTYSLRTAPSLARSMLSCCLVIECMLLVHSQHCSVSLRQWEAQPRPPTANAAQDYRLQLGGCPVLTVPGWPVL